MPLAPGTRIGAYEILSPLGAGGMGEVYRARDARLNRDVAVKVLPEALSKDPDHYARFQREAQALAALNHPNIAAIYGLEENALIMEFVDGETLRTPLPVETALIYARQIAEALEYAHDRNIIHRDLKPANVMITRDGVVKVLDFGLAKVVSAEPQAPSPNSPTLTMRATEVGLIMGTASYMSPEQASGLTVDKRADIWSFGVVLWEMLCGGMLFQGQTVSHTLADVIKGDIDLSKVPAGALRDLVGRCLDRDVKTRLRDIGEARVALANYKPGVVAVEAKSAKARSVPWMIVAAVSLLAAGVGWWRATRPVPLQPLIRLSAEVSPGLALPPMRASQGSGGSRLAISPDGTRIATILSAGAEKGRLYTRLLHNSEATALAGTEGASNPFFSPNGKWIGFFADGKIKKVSIEGGTPIALCDATAVRGAAWVEGAIVAALVPVGGLSRIPDTGGNPVPLTTLREGERTHRQPSAVAGGKAILFISSPAATDYDDADIEAVILATGERKLIMKGGHSPSYNSGHLLHVNGNTLFAAPFDADRLVMTGTASPVLADLSVSGNTGGMYAASPEGTLAYVSGTGGPSRDRSQLALIDPDGKTTVLEAEKKRYSGPSVSPDGKRVAFVVNAGGGSDVWVRDLERETSSRVSFLDVQLSYPIWMPDSQHLLIATPGSVKTALYLVRADGAEKEVRVSDLQTGDWPTDITPDGKHLFVARRVSNRGRDLYIADLEGEGSSLKLGKSRPFVESRFPEDDASVSPDGRWVAYVSEESGRSEIYVRPSSGAGGRWQISTEGAITPRWSRKGSELYFRGRGGLQVVSWLARGDVFAAEKPREWSKSFRVRASYDIAPDGKRIVTMIEDGDVEEVKPDTHLTFLIHFGDELKRRLGAR